MQISFAMLCIGGSSQLAGQGQARWIRRLYAHALEEVIQDAEDFLAQRERMLLLSVVEFADSDAADELKELHIAHAAACRRRRNRSIFG